MQHQCRYRTVAAAIVALAPIVIAGCHGTPPKSRSKSTTSTTVSPAQFRGIAGNFATNVAPIPKGHTSLPANLPASDAWEADRWKSRDSQYEQIKKQIDDAADHTLVQRNGKIVDLGLPAKMAESYRRNAKQRPTDPLAIFGWGYATWVRYNRAEFGRLDRDPELDAVEKAARAIPFPHTQSYALLLFLLSASRDPSPSLLPTGLRLKSRFNAPAVDVELARISVATNGELPKDLPSTVTPYGGWVEEFRLRREMLEAQNRRMPNLETASELIGLYSYVLRSPGNAGLRPELKKEIATLTDQQRAEAAEQSKRSSANDLRHNATFITYTGGWSFSNQTEYAWTDNAHVASWGSTVNGVYPLITDVATSRATVSDPLMYAYPGAPLTASRDGKWLAFIKDPARKPTLSALRLSDGHVMNWPGNTDSTNPVWLPDGKSLVLKRYGTTDLEIYSLGSSTLRKVHIDDNLPTAPIVQSTGGAGDPTPMPASFQREVAIEEHWNNGIVAVAPNGSIIVGPTSVNRSYSAPGQTWDRPEFTVISGDRNPHTVRRIKATVPGNYRRVQMCNIVVSPDGKRILWSFQVDNDNWKQEKARPLSYHYWVSNLDGSSAREIGICADGWASQIAWRPDGKGISFVYQQVLWYLPIAA